MTRVPHRADRIVIPVLLLVFGVATTFATASPGESGTTQAGPVTVTASPDQGLTDGQVVTIHAENPGSEIFEIRAHLCMPNAGVNNTAEFGFQGDYCPNAPIGAGHFDQGVVLPPGTRVADLEFAVGMGGITWVDELGFVHDLTCGPGSPCDLVVQVQIPNDTVYATFPLLIGEGVPVLPPAPAADPEAPPPAPDPLPSPDPAPAPDPVASVPVTTTTQAPAGAKQGGKGGSGSSGGQAGSADADSGAAAPDGAAADDPGVAADGTDRALAAEQASMISPSDTSRGMRVCSGMVAGLVGGVLIAFIIVRARRRMETAYAA